MKKNHALLLAVAASFSAPAMAAPAFYGSIEGGFAQAHNKIPYVINDTTLETTSSEYGDGEAYGLVLGMRLDSPLFVELGYNQTKTEESDSVGQIVIGGGDCDISPLQGIINDCWDRGEIDVEIDRQNIELLAGWTMQAGGFQIQPYAGLRHQTVEDNRKVRYLYNGGVSNFISQNVEYEADGLFVGARIQQDIQQFFWGADVQYAHMDGDNELSIRDTEVNTPGGDVTDFQSFKASEDTKSEQHAIKVFGGIKFDLAGQEARASLGYAYQVNTNVLFTSNTNDDVVPLLTVGDSSADLRTDMIYLSFGMAFK